LKPAVGLHTNGYSLARKLFFEVAGHNASTHLDVLGETIGAALLKQHVSYLHALEGLLDTGQIKGLAHITGGGLTENIPRILPEGVGVTIARETWPVLPVFKLMQELGHVPDAEMYRTFNMGVGMVVICASEDKQAITSHLAARGEACYEIGRVTAGEREVLIG
jgi:phosphoribosylformylglycinamidine cyclo-ligase